MSQEGVMQERERLVALDRYDILDTPSEEAFDRVTRMAQRIFDVPMSTLTLIDGHRQWFKSRQGLNACETSKEPALCNVAIREMHALVVPDTLDDERFAENPFVTGAPGIRFYAGVPLRTPEGHAIGTFCAMDTKPRSFGESEIATLIDLAQMVMSELELRRVAMTDALTGTLSRRAFREEFTRALSLAIRHEHNLACIMIDLDHFKSVNDRYGHAVGDVVLTAATEACRGELRYSDRIGRMGGEEFAVLLPFTGLSSALKVADKLREAIAQLEIPTSAGAINVTASFGVAALDACVGDMDTLLRHADAALYQAKAGGRNQCRAWPSADQGKRKTRVRVLKAGRISFAGAHSPLDCTIRTLSDDSASLRIISSADLPEQFDLVIESDGVSRSCRVMAKAEQVLDVAFV
jgi:diguanylate cyclase (GGDEF)-like protein